MSLVGTSVTPDKVDHGFSLEPRESPPESTSILERNKYLVIYDFQWSTNLSQTVI